jgi:hypothetical protein
VDVSDTPPASGNTKRISINNILSSSPTASGALTVTGLVTAGSATITGDLTVDTSTLKVDSTNNRVGIGTASPATILDIQSAGGVFARIQNTTSSADAYLLVKNTTGEGFFGINALGPYIYTASALPILFTIATSERYRIAGDGVATWSNVGGVAGTAMTLNSTGLGVGVVPSSFGRFSVQGTAGGAGILGMNTNATQCDIQSYTMPLALNRAGNNITMCEGGGNVGVGVTPSAWGSNYKVIESAGNASAMFAGANVNGVQLSSNCYNDNTNWIYKTTGTAARFGVNNSQFQWNIAGSGTAGNPFTFTQAMTLSASGDLLVGTPLANATWATRLTLSTDIGTTRWAVGPYVAPQNFVISAGGATGVYLNGTAATSWSSASDERLKDIIEPISNAVAKVSSLRAVIGKFKFDENNTRKPFLIAQDVQSVLPEAVDASNPDQLGVAYTDVIPLLVAAIKELTTRVQTLEAR